MAYKLDPSKGQANNDGIVLTVARVLYASQGYCTHDRRFLLRLIAAGHDVWFLPCEAASIQQDVAPAGSASRWLRPLTENGLSFRTLPWSTAAERFRRIVQSISPDLVHAGPVPTAGLLAALSGFHPLLIMSWGSDMLSFPDTGPDEWQITKFTLCQADMAIGDCNAVRERITEISCLPARRIVCLPWGVDLQQFRPKASVLGLRHRLGWNGCKVVVTARALEPAHCPFVFLQAIVKVLEDGYDVRAVMLGDGSLRQGVESFIWENNLSSRVHLAGQVPEEVLPDYFAESDLYVCATRCDGSSVSLLQAMACGLPAVVVAGNGNNEWIVHEQNGWLYPAGDADVLTRAIVDALRDDSRRQWAGERNIQIAQTRADWDRNFTCVLAAYDELLAGKWKTEVRNELQLQNR